MTPTLLLNSYANTYVLLQNAVNIITKKLTPAEITFLERALAYYGRGPMRWDVICRDYLRHRHPMVLSMLWSEHLKRGTQPEDPAVQPALMAGQKNARQAARPAAAATAPGPAPAAAPQAPGQAPPESQNVGDFGAAVAAVAEAMYGPRAVPAPEPNANASVAHGAATAGGAVHDAYPPATTAAATFVGAGAGQQPSQAQQAQQDLHAAWQQAMGPGCWPMMMPGMGLPMMGAAMGMPGMIPGMGMPMVPGHSMQSMHGMHGMMYPGFYMPNMAPGPAGMAAQYPWPYPGSPGPMQQPAQQQQQGVLAGPSAAVARGGAGEDGSGWSADDNRTVLYAAVENGGAFSDEDMQKLAEKLGKSKEEVMNRWNSVLASRFKEKVRQMVDMD